MKFLTNHKFQRTEPSQSELQTLIATLCHIPENVSILSSVGGIMVIKVNVDGFVGPASSSNTINLNSREMMFRQRAQQLQMLVPSTSAPI